ncbi:MAG: helix-turn-helix domain-containing protein [Pilosibacter sp.]|jgi:putative transposase
MISASDRENAVLLINEAIASGASCKKACYRLGITERTFYRWKKRKSDINSYEDGRPTADHSEPANKIPTETRKEIINICNKPEYASMALNIPLRRSRLSGKMETTCPDRRKPL